MATGLPTEDGSSKAVQDFGLGPYDSSSSDSSRGEDDESAEPRGPTLPDDGGPFDPFGPDRLLSYPELPTSQGKHAFITGSYLRHLALITDRPPSRRLAEDLPGDEDKPPTSRRPEDDTIRDPLPSGGASELPSDAGNPSARSDYYDRMQTGVVEHTWPDEDTGAYAGDDASELPGVAKNETTMDDFLGALGNSWSGHEIEDVSGPQGFPTQDFSENVNFDRSDLQDGGRVVAMQFSSTGNDMNHGVRRQATNIELTGELAKQFLKEFGKKDLTRRHVMAFLQDLGQPQFLASDIIRCLKHRHKVVIADVLDQFPVSKEASCTTPGVSSLWNRFINLEIEHLRSPEVASVFRRCAADLAHVLADMERLEGRNG